MRIIGIDPGPKETAFALMDFFNEGKIIHKGKVPNNLFVQFLASLGRNENEYPGMAAVEGLQSFGMPVGSETFETAYFIGELKQIIKYRLQIASSFELVYRKDIKIHFCNSMRAKDANIRQAMIDRYGPQGTKKNPGLLYGVSGDMWSAVAIATYAYDKFFKS
jgi:hypothetical protein